MIRKRICFAIRKKNSELLSMKLQKKKHDIKSNPSLHIAMPRCSQVAGRFLVPIEGLKGSAAERFEGPQPQ